jgi:hypothetical protein
MIADNRLGKALLAFVVVCSTALPVCADDSGINWSRLNLTAQQQGQIQQLEVEWSAKYQRLQPQIIEGKKKLQKLFADPNTDPLEIMNTQQSVMRLQEELRTAATANHLQKRAVLTVPQRRQYEMMLQTMLVERQRGNLGSHGQSSTGLMDMIQKARWAIGGPQPKNKEKDKDNVAN